MDQFLAKHGSLVTWLVGTLVAVGIAWGSASSDARALQRQLDDHKAVEAQQLDRIEQRVKSIDEFLRQPRN